MKIIGIFLVLIPASLVAQTTWTVPKHSPSYKRASRDFGPFPGSKALPDARNATFKRIQSRPAGMRLLVRTNCGSAPRRGELISKARRLTTSDGPVVQLDWEPINGDKVIYFVVASAVRKVTTLELEAVDGKYKTYSKKVAPQEHWEVQRLNLGPQDCVEDKDLKSRDVRLAVVNFLNKFSVDFFRRDSDQFSSN